MAASGCSVPPPSSVPSEFVSPWLPPLHATYFKCSCLCAFYRTRGSLRLASSCIVSLHATHFIIRSFGAFDSTVASSPPLRHLLASEEVSRSFVCAYALLQRKTPASEPQASCSRLLTSSLYPHRFSSKMFRVVPAQNAASFTLLQVAMPAVGPHPQLLKD